QEHSCNNDPQSDAGHPAHEGQPCDNMPHVISSVQHLHSSPQAVTPRRLVNLRIILVASLSMLIVSAAVARAQGRVAGRIVDQTGAVLPGVTIDLVVNKSELTTISNDQGQYEFDEIPPGAAELTYRLINFGVLRRTVNVAGAPIDVDAILTLALNADV